MDRIDHRNIGEIYIDTLDKCTLDLKLKSLAILKIQFDQLVLVKLLGRYLSSFVCIWFQKA